MKVTDPKPADEVKDSTRPTETKPPSFAPPSTGSTGKFSDNVKSKMKELKKESPDASRESLRKTALDAAQKVLGTKLTTRQEAKVGRNKKRVGSSGKGKKAARVAARSAKQQSATNQGKPAEPTGSFEKNKTY